MPRSYSSSQSSSDKPSKKKAKQLDHKVNNMKEKSVKDSRNIVPHLNETKIIPIDPKIYSPINDMVNNDQALLKWASCSNSNGIEIASQLERVCDVVQKHYIDHVQGQESSLSSTYVYQVTSEKTKLCEMVYASCQKLYELRKQLTEQSKILAMTNEERVAMINNVQNLFSEVSDAQQRCITMGSLLNSMSQEMNKLKQESEVKRLENDSLQASLQNMEQNYSAEVEGMKNQFHLQTM